MPKSYQSLRLFYPWQLTTMKSQMMYGSIDIRQHTCKDRFLCLCLGDKRPATMYFWTFEGAEGLLKFWSPMPRGQNLW